MIEEEWALVVAIFREVRSKPGEEGRDDRRFLRALHCFVHHNITWRALPAEFGSWNGVWKRFRRLSRSGTFEAFFQALAARSRMAGQLGYMSEWVDRRHPQCTRRPELAG